MKLFNAIQQSQVASAAAAEELKSHRGTGKPTLPAPTIQDKKKKGKQKDSGIVKGREGLSLCVLFIVSLAHEYPSQHLWPKMTSWISFVRVALFQRHDVVHISDACHIFCILVYFM